MLVHIISHMYPPLGGTLAPADVTDEVAQGMSPDDFSRVLRDASTSEERTQVGRTMMREAARQRKERKVGMEQSAKLYTWQLSRFF